MIAYALAAGLAGLVTAGYNTMSPRSQLYGRTFIGRRGVRQLALTFDDGPNDPCTLQLLEVLARHQVSATFFVLGQFVNERPDILREIARAGHAIGNHTYNHPLLIFANRKQVEAQVRDCQHAIEDALGSSRLAHGSQTRALTTAGLFRPPHGGRTPGVLRTVRRMDYVPVMWSVSGWDWSAKSADQIERTVTRQVRGGEVILLHDGGHERMGVDRSFSVAASDRIIARYKSEGYQFVTVPELMAA